MNSSKTLISLADNIALFVCRLRRRKEPDMPYDLFDSYNDWTHATGIILRDTESVVQVCQLMSILFRIPMPMLVAVLQFDHLAVE